jgi:predicted ATP-grasp superfamily ATP-dependent carboligase
VGRKIRVLIGNHSVWKAKVAAVADPETIELLPWELNDATVAAPEVDVIIPLGFSEYRTVQASPLACSRALLPSEEHVELASDKYRFAQWMIAHGFAAHTPALLDRNAGLPLLLKARRLAQGKDVRLITRPEELPADLHPSGVDEEFFLQEYIPGQVEWSTHLIAHHGTIHKAVTAGFRHSGAFHVRGVNDYTDAECVRVDFVPPVIARMVRALGYTGPACFDYKLEAEEPKMFEMNPRFGNSFFDVCGRIDAYAALVMARRSR